MIRAVGVIVPAHDEQDLLPACLAALRRAARVLRGTPVHLVAVHWRHPAPDHPRAGDEVHRHLAAHAGLARLAHYRDPDFAAEVYARSDGDLKSVAQAGGIA